MSKETVDIKKKRAVFTYISFLTLLILFLVGLFLFFPNLLLGFFFSFPLLLSLVYLLLPCVGIILGLLGIRHNLTKYSILWAIPPAIGTLLNLTVLIFMVTVFHFSFSAYGACRKMAMNQKGYAIWKYQSTIQEKSFVRVIFSDGTNDLSCQANAIGPFWITTRSGQTIVGCVKSFGPPVISCPEGYFGVSP